MPACSWLFEHLSLANLEQHGTEGTASLRTKALSLTGAFVLLCMLESALFYLQIWIWRSSFVYACHLCVPICCGGLRLDAVYTLPFSRDIVPQTSVAVEIAG